LKARTVSFREIQDAHKKDRAADARALRSGRATVSELQELNSFIPAGASMRIVNLASYVRNRRPK
jgi:hypothetical protein